MGVNYRLAVMLKRSSRRQKVLRIIAESQVPLNSNDISKRSGIAQSNIILLLNKLEAEGALREVTGSERDRMWEITRKGKEALLTKEKLLSMAQTTPRSRLNLKDFRQNFL